MADKMVPSQSVIKSLFNNPYMSDRSLIVSVGTGLCSTKSPSSGVGPKAKPDPGSDDSDSDDSDCDDSAKTDKDEVSSSSNPLTPPAPKLENELAGNLESAKTKGSGESKHTENLEGGSVPEEGKQDGNSESVDTDGVTQNELMKEENLGSVEHESVHLSPDSDQTNEQEKIKTNNLNLYSQATGDKHEKEMMNEGMDRYQDEEPSGCLGAGTDDMTYHVHSFLLSVKSWFFNTLFHGSNMLESCQKKVGHQGQMNYKIRQQADYIT